MGNALGTYSPVATSTLGITATVATSSLDAWFATKDTDDLTGGLTNLYFSNSLARSALSETIAGIDYSTSTGIFGLASGYAIPLSASTTNWQTAFSWGDHASAGYLETESDPVFVGSDAYAISAADIGDWNSAFGWGDHASAGYLTAVASSTVRGMLSASSPLTYNSGTGALGFTNPGYITGVSWGAITGTLSAQTDLQAALDAKLSTTTAASTYYPLGNPAGYFDALSDFTGTLTNGRLCTYDSGSGEIDCDTAAGGAGTVTSVAMTVPTGLAVTGSPVTTSGTLALALDTGFVIPLTASTTEWTTAYGWGDHSAGGYLTSESDPVFSGSDVFGVTTADIGNWDDAFGWGDHASEGYLTTVGPTNLSSSDFGDFTCNGTTCSLDADTVSDSEIDYANVTLNDFTFDVGSVSKTEFGYLSGVTSAIQTQLNGKLTASNILDDLAQTSLADPGSDQLVFWDDSDTQFEFISTLSGLSISGNTLSVTDVTCTGCLGSTEIAGLDISDDTNLAAGRSLTLSGDSIEADAELYTDTKCIWFENPTADDDFKSIWANKTAGDITLTEIWAESDQTVAFDLQIDDGSPADVNGTDITPAAGEAEDTSLSGDTTLAAGEELDLAITSVSSDPTWVSICWTFTRND